MGLMAAQTIIYANHSKWMNLWRASVPCSAVRDHEKASSSPKRISQIDTAEREVRIDGGIAEVPRREYYALELLMRRTGSVVSKKSMEDLLYSFGEEIASNAVEVLIHRLRKRLLDHGAGAVIHTIRGVGYMLAAEARKSA